MDGWSDLAHEVSRQEREKARREGVIEGLERALGHVDNPKLSYDDILTVIRAEIERLRRGE